MGSTKCHSKVSPASQPSWVTVFEDPNLGPLHYQRVRVVKCWAHHRFASADLARWSSDRPHDRFEPRGRRFIGDLFGWGEL